MSKLVLQINCVPKRFPKNPFLPRPKLISEGFFYRITITDFNFPSLKNRSRAHALWQSVCWGANFAFGDLVLIQSTCLNCVQCCKVGLAWHVYAVIAIKVSVLSTTFSSENCWGCFSILAHTCATIVSCFMYCAFDWQQSYLQSQFRRLAKKLHATCITLLSLTMLCGLKQLSNIAITWLILPVVICLSQRLSHACLSISFNTAKLRMAH